MPPSPVSGSGTGAPPTPPLSPSHDQRNVIIGAVSAIILLIALFAGIELARSNSDIICTKAVNEEGGCTNGTWGPWTVVSQSVNQTAAAAAPPPSACTVTVNEARTYTGTREAVTASFTFSANRHTYCNVGVPGGAQGTITSQFTACQIQETRTRLASGTGSGASCVMNTTPSSSGIVDQRTVISQNRTETKGDVVGTAQIVTGSYQDYLDTVEAKLAVSSIFAIPSVIKRGDTTRILWRSEHMRSCQVVGSNGDSWGVEPPPPPPQQIVNEDGSITEVPVQRAPWVGMLASDPKGEDSSPIMQQTIYTLTCVTKAGKAVTAAATVDSIPEFQEK